MLTPKSRRNIIAAGVVVLLAIVLALANRWSQRQRQPAELETSLKALVHKAAQYNGAAQQDTNPLFALLHANYGLAYWTVARSLASDQDLMQLTRYNPVLLGEQLNSALQAAMQTMAAPQNQAFSGSP